MDEPVFYEVGEGFVVSEVIAVIDVVLDKEDVLLVLAVSLCLGGVIVLPGKVESGKQKRVDVADRSDVG